MLERLTGIFKARAADVYVQRVTTALVRDGLQFSDLDAFQSAPGFDASGHVFALLREQNLSPPEAAEALRLAVNLFRKSRYMAEATGWPLHAEPPVAADVTGMEAYFLELLNEAVRSVRFKA